ncbi:hypothetical protein GBAR_LOCUS11782 [Geodia barretti]|uniref:Uncharacterized protein n=1 Tax=Geodia barretti TaxID=519541 RepID=A0AA35WM83_GEOBA|nr:hypothetical protein GBAR_LOCUS11782 [Geodia barretti]
MLFFLMHGQDHQLWWCHTCVWVPHNYSRTPWEVNRVQSPEHKSSGVDRTKNCTSLPACVIDHMRGHMTSRDLWYTILSNFLPNRPWASLELTSWG